MVSYRKKLNIREMITGMLIMNFRMLNFSQTENKELTRDVWETLMPPSLETSVKKMNGKCK